MQALNRREEDAAACPDCIFDAIAVVLDMWDVYENGLSWSSGLALLGDGAALAVPGVPAVAGTTLRGARVTAIREALRIGREEHKAFGASNRAQGFFTERFLQGNKFKPDAVHIDHANRRVVIYELKPATPTGDRAMDIARERYTTVVQRLVDTDGWLFSSEHRVDGYSVHFEGKYYYPRLTTPHPGTGGGPGGPPQYDY